MSSVRVCLFDIDGTLISTGGAGKAALEAALREEFGLEDIVQTVEFAGRTDRGILRDHLVAHQLDDSGEHLARLISAYLRNLPLSLAERQGRVLPGVEELIDALLQRDIGLGLLTGNMRRGARAKLRHFDLWRHFPFGAYGDHHTDRNEVAAHALEEVASHVKQYVPGERICIIGDTPLDIQCARHIGAKAVAVATGVHNYQELAELQPDLMLEDLSDAGEVLRLLA